MVLGYEQAIKASNSVHKTLFVAILFINVSKMPQIIPNGFCVRVRLVAYLQTDSKQI